MCRSLVAPFVASEVVERVAGDLLGHLEVARDVVRAHPVPEVCLRVAVPLQVGGRYEPFSGDAAYAPFFADPVGSEPLPPDSVGASIALVVDQFVGERVTSGRADEAPVDEYDGAVAVPVAHGAPRGFR